MYPVRLRFGNTEIRESCHLLVSRTWARILNLSLILRGLPGKFKVSKTGSLA